MQLLNKDDRQERRVTTQNIFPNSKMPSSFPTRWPTETKAPMMKQPNKKSPRSNEVQNYFSVSFSQKNSFYAMSIRIKMTKTSKEIIVLMQWLDQSFPPISHYHQTTTR